MILGSIDALKGGILYGWAFNSEDAGEHVSVRVHHGDRVVAEGSANLMRADLPEAGVGRGDHAFEITLPDDIQTADDIVAVAYSARHGEVILSDLGSGSKQLNALFHIYSARYNAVLLRLKTTLDDINGEMDVIKNSDVAQHTAHLDSVEERLTSLDKRIEGIEVFLVRMDEAMHRIAGPKKRQRSWNPFRLFR